MSMNADLTKEVIPENDEDYEKIVEEIFDEKYGRNRYVVKRVKKQRDQESDEIDATDSIQSTSFFKRRTEDLGLDKKIGERINVMKESHKSDHGGFYCQLCDTHVWDSNAWLDHLNGKKHNRLLGMNNKVEKVGIDDIKAKLQSLKKEKIEKNKAYELMLSDFTEEQSNKKIKAQNDRKKLKTEDDASTFGPSIPENLRKKDKNENDEDEDEKEQNKNQAKEDGKKDNEQQNEQEEEEEEEDPNAAMMAMMGLPTSFNTRNKK